MSLRTVKAIRYITPMREGGSMPALVEADDGGQYVVKLRGAGQGTLALVAELVSGEIARVLGLFVPELVFVEIDPLFGKAERDPEIQHLLRASTGINIGLKFLPGSTTFDPAAGDTIDPATASLLVWCDAFTLNVDRTSRNANLLLWSASSSSPQEVWLIDHGASLYFHHNWPSAPEKALAKFEQVAEHILLRWATEVPAASVNAHQAITPALLSSILEQVPADWIEARPPEVTVAQRRNDYLDFLLKRLEHSYIFEQEVQRAGGNSI